MTHNNIASTDLDKGSNSSCDNEYCGGGVNR